MEPAERIEATEPDDPIDASEPIEPIDSTDAAEPIDPTERTEPTEPIDRIELRLAIERTEFEGDERATVASIMTDPPRSSSAAELRPLAAASGQAPGRALA